MEKDSQLLLVWICLPRLSDVSIIGTGPFIYALPADQFLLNNPGLK